MSVLDKFSLIDLETQKWATRAKRKRAERLNEKTLRGCDSLNTAYNKMKAVKGVRRVSLARNGSNKFDELEQGYMDLMTDCNRQFSWDGTCTLAATNTASVASTSLVIGGRESVEPALKFIDVGMVLDIYDSTGATLKASAVTVNSISSGTAASLTATIVLDQPVTSAVGDILVRAQSKGNEIQGLLYALDGGTTTIYNVDRSAYIQYQGNVTDNSAAQLTLDKMQQVYNEGLRRGGAKYNAIFTDFNSLRMYQKLLTADKRYSNTIKGKHVH